MIDFSLTKVIIFKNFLFVKCLDSYEKKQTTDR